jgi:hypothetical protein
VRQDPAGQEVVELLLHEGRQRHAVRLPPGRLEEGVEVLVDHAVQHRVLGVARPVVADAAKHNGDIGALRERPQCPAYLGLRSRFAVYRLVASGQLPALRLANKLRIDQSIRENEPRTRAIGYAGERYKIVAVMLSGLFAGLAGVLYAIQNKFAAPDFVFFLISGEVVIFNVMGGVGTLVGPIAGAAFFLLLREGLSRYFEYYLIPVGIIFTLMVIFLPQGFLGFLRRPLNR